MTHSLSSRHVAGAGVVVSPYVETREIFLPSLDTVHGHCDHGVDTTRDHYGVSVWIRDGAGCTEINTVKNLKKQPHSIAFNSYYVSYLSGKPGSWVPSGVTSVVVLLLSLPPMR